MKLRCLSVFLHSLLLCGIANAQSDFPVVTLSAGVYEFKVEVAATEAAREQGLMFRKYMGDNAGMLFDFERPAQKTCMWMKNTLIPLSVAFIDSEGKIINIEDMQPQTLDNHCSSPSSPVRYALEVNQGWFAQKHLTAGSRIDGLVSPK